MSDQTQTKPRELRPAQQDAAYTLDCHISVTAGPGSGKTTVLVERYLSILRQKRMSVDQIVAITFTNRAANEMRSRLRKEFDRLLHTSAPAERRMWLRHKRTLDGAIITTIHGFCSRLLREFPLEAGMDPQFALMDEHQSAMLEEVIVDEVVSSALDAGNDALTHLALSVGRAGLSNAILQVFRSMRNQGLNPDDVERVTAQSHATLEHYQSCLEELDEGMAEFIAWQGLSKTAEALRLAAEQKWPDFKRKLQDPPRFHDIAGFCEQLKVFRKETKPVASGKLKELVTRLTELIWENDAGGRLPQICFDVFAKEYALELLTIIRIVDRRLAEEKRNISALSFDDLQLRTLDLLKNREDVRRRILARYKYFLVDEFQDTNGLQQEMLKLLALEEKRSSNLFIVGDPKQSIYGFRGADVNVFSALTEQIEAAGGERKPLHLNFRSQPQLIGFFNELFKRVFASGEASPAELQELGFVAYEDSVAERPGEDNVPQVEVLIDIKRASEEAAVQSTVSSRERDAFQIANQISRLMKPDELSSAEGSESSTTGRRFRYRDFALLFRAMTDVGVYEATFRRAGIPYRTVAGKGFYQREEVTDLIQLLRFLDNTTDEVSLAAVLRSPLCCVSDNALMALRCAPLVGGESEGDELARVDGVRSLYKAVLLHETIDLIDSAERPSLDQAREFLADLHKWRHRLSIPEVLRRAINECEYLSVIGATYDGALRVSNVEKLLSLAERFARSGAFTVRDFVRYVDDFEKRGGRESEGTLDSDVDAVTLMSIHQSKGLEFPVVVLPDLHRTQSKHNAWYMLDRHRGLTLKVPDGSGGSVCGTALSAFRERAEMRERFESMRLLYVAATRAQDRLILSGAADDLTNLGKADNTWLSWIWQALTEGRDVPESEESIDLNGVQVRLQVSSFQAASRSALGTENPVLDEATTTIDWSRPIADYFPLLRALEPPVDGPLRHLNVSQLTSFSQCPRRYYFRHVLSAPEVYAQHDKNLDDDIAPRANMSAMLRGSVIHRFCENYTASANIDDCLRVSLSEVRRERHQWLKELEADFDEDATVRSLRRLARNFADSQMFRRLDGMHRSSMHPSRLDDQVGDAVAFSEHKFVLRRRSAMLSGTIDKLVLTRSAGRSGWDAEIIDFKTDRLRVSNKTTDNRAFDGMLPFENPEIIGNHELIEAEVERLASTYLIQMQSYAIAARLLVQDVGNVSATLHFLDRNFEHKVPAEYLEIGACGSAVDRTTEKLASCTEIDDFTPESGEHCQQCGYRNVCSTGQLFMREKTLTEVVRGQQPESLDETPYT